MTRALLALLLLALAGCGGTLALSGGIAGVWTPGGRPLRVSVPQLRPLDPDEAPTMLPPAPPLADAGLLPGERP